MAIPQEGAEAPNFTVLTDEGKQISLADFKGQNFTDTPVHAEPRQSSAVRCSSVNGFATQTIVTALRPAAYVIN